MSDLQALRDQLVKLLDFKEAHVDFDHAITGIPPEQRGAQPTGCPHSLWQLLEHLRSAQHDILDFCVNAKYEEKTWPDDYWPEAAGPPSAAAWDEAVAAFRRDRESLMKLTRDPNINLFAKIPHGTGQTYLREVLLVADHNAYHIGQLIAVRQQLGIWPS